MLYDLLGNNLSETTLDLLAKAERFIEDDTPLQPVARVWTPASGWGSMSPSQLMSWSHTRRFSGTSIRNIDDAVTAHARDSELKIMLTGRAWHLPPVRRMAPPWSLFRVRVRPVGAREEYFAGCTMIPRVPESTMAGENRETPRIPVASSIAGAMASMVISERLDGGTEGVAIEVLSNTDPVEVILPSIFEVPDAWATEEAWIVDPVQLSWCMRIADQEDVEAIDRIDHESRTYRMMEDLGVEAVMLRCRLNLDDYLRRLD